MAVNKFSNLACPRQVEGEEPEVVVFWRWVAMMQKETARVRTENTVDKLESSLSVFLQFACIAVSRLDH